MSWLHYTWGLDLEGLILRTWSWELRRTLCTWRTPTVLLDCWPCWSVVCMHMHWHVNHATVDYDVLMYSSWPPILEICWTNVELRCPKCHHLESYIPEGSRCMMSLYNPINYANRFHGIFRRDHEKCSQVWGAAHQRVIHMQSHERTIVHFW